ncbi:acidPPc domain-containing protein [Ruminococcaceae bacterium BL-6]|nr:acidPPc domain-containing protein [Ruminococcaceae bacterium BL-6]HBC27367.1 hypothetical protein [Oscillospiraceae bacterium]HBN79933.1 hypothetical protein [Oscillospiraceae bacterium]
MFAMIQRADVRVLRLIQKYLRCSLFDTIMPYISLVGNIGAVWVTVMIVFLLIPQYRDSGLELFGVLAICGILTNFVLKPLVARPRPCHAFPRQELLVPCPTDFSFPSGHTMSSFGAALIIYNTNQALGVIAFIFAFLIAFSRLYLFVHYPSDVITGMLLGLASSFPLILLFAALCAFVYYGSTKIRRSDR